MAARKGRNLRSPSVHWSFLCTPHEGTAVPGPVLLVITKAAALPTVVQQLYRYFLYITYVPYHNSSTRTVIFSTSTGSVVAVR